MPESTPRSNRRPLDRGWTEGALDLASGRIMRRSPEHARNETLPIMRWIPLGDSAVLLTPPRASAVGAIAKMVAEVSPPGFIECIPAFDSVAICFDPLRVAPAELMAALAKTLARAAKSRPRPRANAREQDRPLRASRAQA
jgi:hypothetical protein